MSNNVETRNNELTVDGIRAAIEILANAEKVTKATLGQLSRDLLTFVVLDGNHRVELVNELLRVLTPMNKATAILYFKHHLAWSFDESISAFTTMFDAGKKTDLKYAACQEIMADPSQNIWTWAESNVKVDKVPDYANRVSTVIKQALKGKGDEGEGKLSPAMVLMSVMSAGISAEDMMDIIDAATAIEPETIEGDLIVIDVPAVEAA